MSEFEYQGRRFSIGKMPAIVQDPVMRKLTKIAPAFIQIFMDDKRIMDALKKSVAGEVEAIRGTMTPADALDLFTKNFDKITAAIAALSDDDSAFIISKCMAVVSVQPQGANGWQPVWNEAAGRFQYAELEEDLLAVYWICFHVLKEKLGNFISALLRQSSAAGG